MKIYIVIQYGNYGGGWAVIKGVFSKQEDAEKLYNELKDIKAVGVKTRFNDYELQ